MDLSRGNGTVEVNGWNCPSGYVVALDIEVWGDEYSAYATAYMTVEEARQVRRDLATAINDAERIARG